MRKTLSGSAMILMALFLFGCALTDAPDPTVLEATIAARVVATQTANAPTATLTPSATPTPSATATLAIPTPAVPAGWRLYNRPDFSFSFSYPPEWEEPLKLDNIVQFQFKGHLVDLSLSQRTVWPAGTFDEAMTVLVQLGQGTAPGGSSQSDLLFRGAYGDSVHIGVISDWKIKSPGFDGYQRSVYLRARDNHIANLIYAKDNDPLTETEREAVRMVTATIREGESVVALALPTLIVPTPSNTPLATSTPRPTATPDVISLIPAKRQFNHPFKIATEYDKFKDRTFITLNYIAGGSTKPDKLYVYWSYPGTVLTSPDRVYMSFISSSKDWQFLSVRVVEMVLDANQRARFDATRDGQVGSGFVIENIDTILTLTQFLPIVNAKQVDVRIGSVEFALTAAQLEGLRDLASRMNP